jgi:hypothetical protein
MVSLIDLPDDWNRTPLFHVTVTGNVAVVAIRLAHGSSALDCSTNVSRTPRSVVEEWCRHRLHLDSAHRDTVKAMSDLFHASASRKLDSIGDAEINLTLCSPGEMTGSSHYDLWRHPKTGSKCLMCV